MREEFLYMQLEVHTVDIFSSIRGVILLLNKNHGNLCLLLIPYWALWKRCERMLCLCVGDEGVMDFSYSCFPCSHLPLSIAVSSATFFLSTNLKEKHLSHH